jgi:hypothetical protein
LLAAIVSIVHAVLDLITSANVSMKSTPTC